MVRGPERLVMHRLREALRGQQLRKLEQRRPRQFEGMRGEVLKDVLNAAPAKHTDVLGMRWRGRLGRRTGRFASG